MSYRSGSTMKVLSGYLQHWKERGEDEVRAASQACVHDRNQPPVRSARHDDRAGRG